MAIDVNEKRDWARGVDALPAFFLDRRHRSVHLQRSFLALLLVPDALWNVIFEWIRMICGSREATLWLAQRSCQGGDSSGRRESEPLHEVSSTALTRAVAINGYMAALSLTCRATRVLRRSGTWMPPDAGTARCVTSLGCRMLGLPLRV